MPHLYQTEAEILHIVERFRDRTLPTTAWTHEAHLTVATWFLKNFSLAEATCYLRSGIITYNQTSGGENTPQRGYHETLTLFWIQVIAEFIEENKELNLLDLCNSFISNELASKELPFHYYTREVVFSTQARAFWIEPNLKKLDCEIPRKIIDKVAWLRLEEGQILGTRSKGKEKYYLPGGKREKGESDAETLIREIKEELDVDLTLETIQYFNVFQAQADGHSAQVEVKMTCYLAEYAGQLKASAEIEEVAWLTYADRDRVALVDQLIFDYLKAEKLLD